MSPATGLSLNVAAGATSATQTIDDVVSMDTGAPDASGRHLHHRATLTGMQA
ncbi:MAG: hypothetical protein R2713_10360 [Ilumatobacteraceae bacterium]